MPARVQSLKLEVRIPRRDDNQLLTNQLKPTVHVLHLLQSKARET